MAGRVDRILEDLRVPDEDAQILALTSLTRLDAGRDKQVRERLPELRSAVEIALDSPHTDVVFLARKAATFLDRVASGPAPVSVPGAKKGGAGSGEWDLATALAELREGVEDADRDEILSCLRHAEPRVRANAVEVLDRRMGPELQPYLMPLLRDPHHRVRSVAVVALGKRGHAQVDAQIDLMMASPEIAFREAAVFAMGELRRPAHLERLIRASEDEHPDVRLRATEVLVKSGWEGAEEAIDDRREDPDPRVRAAAGGAVPGGEPVPSPPPAAVTSGAAPTPPSARARASSEAPPPARKPHPPVPSAPGGVDDSALDFDSDESPPLDLLAPAPTGGKPVSRPGLPLDLDEDAKAVLSDLDRDSTPPGRPEATSAARPGPPRPPPAKPGPPPPPTGSGTGPSKLAVPPDPRLLDRGIDTPPPPPVLAPPARPSTRTTAAFGPGALLRMLEEDLGSSPPSVPPVPPPVRSERVGAGLAPAGKPPPPPPPSAPGKALPAPPATTPIEKRSVASPGPPPVEKQRSAPPGPPPVEKQRSAPPGPPPVEKQRSAPPGSPPVEQHPAAPPGPPPIEPQPAAPPEPTPVPGPAALAPQAPAPGSPPEGPPAEPPSPPVQLARLASPWAGRVLDLAPGETDRDQLLRAVRPLYDELLGTERKARASRLLFQVGLAALAGGAPDLQDDPLRNELTELERDLEGGRDPDDGDPSVRTRLKEGLQRLGRARLDKRRSGEGPTDDPDVEELVALFEEAAKAKKSGS